MTDRDCFEALHLVGASVMFAGGFWKPTSKFCASFWSVVVGLQIMFLGCPLEVIGSFIFKDQRPAGGVQILYAEFGPVVAIPIWLLTTGLMIFYWKAIRRLNRT